jgi:hypothetical protein
LSSELPAPLLSALVTIAPTRSAALGAEPKLKSPTSAAVAVVAQRQVDLVLVHQHAAAC